MDNILSRPNETIKAKYYYTMIKAFLSNAKRFKLIKGSSNRISYDLLFESLVQLNKSGYTRDKYDRDIEEIKQSFFFKKFTKDYIEIKSNKQLFDNDHYLFSDRILLKGEILNESRFLRESIYFLKSKPLSTTNRDDIQVVSDRSVSDTLGVSADYISKVTRGFLKVYKMQITCGRGYYTQKDKGYQYKINAQGESYSSKVVGSRMIANIYFKSKIKVEDKIVKKRKIANSKTTKEKRLELFKKKNRVLLNKYGFMNIINKNIRLGEIDIHKDNKLITPYINLNIVNSNYKNVKETVLKIIHLIEFSNHIQSTYKKKIHININESNIDEIYKYLVGFYINLKNRKIVTRNKFNMMNRVFRKRLGFSVDLCRKDTMLKINKYLKEKE